MSTPPEIINVVATARFGKRLDRWGQFTPNVFIAARVRVNGTNLRFFPNGKAVASGARSPMAALAAFVVIARRLRTRVRKFTVVNMVAKWTIPRQNSAGEVQRIAAPRACVYVSPRGYVVCVGVTNRAEVKRVHALIH